MLDNVYGCEHIRVITLLEDNKIKQIIGADKGKLVHIQECFHLNVVEERN